MNKYEKWIKNNTISLSDKTVLIIGATGTIGKEVLNYLLQLNANVVIGARNIVKAEHLKIDMQKIYPDSQISIYEVDVSCMLSIDNLYFTLKKDNVMVDIFINNSGVYHLPQSFSNEGYEIHFATNTLGNYYLATKISDIINEDGKMIFTSSLSAKYFSVDLFDMQSLKCKNKIKLYARSKRMMTINALGLKNNDVKINLVHPGVCATELFEKSHSKFFIKVLYPVMKLIFHSPKKAALSIIKGIYINTKVDEWIAPRGLFEIWGFPKVKKIKKSLFNNEMDTKIIEETNKMVNSKYQ